jgi:hypothetical protein
MVYFFNMCVTKQSRFFIICGGETIATSQEWRGGVMPYFAQHATRIMYGRFVLGLVLLAIGLGVGIAAGLNMCSSVVPPTPPVCQAHSG